jgi:hypothetical protein
MAYLASCTWLISHHLYCYMCWSTPCPCVYLVCCVVLFSCCCSLSLSVARMASCASFLSQRVLLLFMLANSMSLCVSHGMLFSCCCSLSLSVGRMASHTSLLSQRVLLLLMWHHSCSSTFHIQRPCSVSNSTAPRGSSTLHDTSNIWHYTESHWLVIAAPLNGRFYFNSQPQVYCIHCMFGSGDAACLLAMHAGCCLFSHV